MSPARRTPSRPATGGVPPRLAALFLLALAGVLAVVGTGVLAVAGPLALAGYGVAVAVLVGGLVVRARRLVRARERATAARTCTRCTATHADPVQVV